MVKEAVVYRTPGSFAAESGTRLVNEEGDGKKRKGRLMVKAGDCYPGELSSIPSSAQEFLWAAGQVTSTRLFIAGYSVFLILRAWGLSCRNAENSPLEPKSMAIREDG